MKIYTKTGDRGETGLFGGARVSKASGRVHVYGEVDELNSVIGLACAECSDGALVDALHRVQEELFTVGAELASDPSKQVKLGIELLDASAIARLESEIDTAEQSLSPLKTFVLPGGTRCAASLHLARTTCRRAERALVAFIEHEPVRDTLLQYLNRLSDWLFVMARAANHRAGVADVPWLGRKAT